MKIRSALSIAAASLALAAGPSFAQSQQDEIACMSDAFNICGHAIPDRDRVGSCLAQNMKRLSSGCRAAMQRNWHPPRRARARISER